MKCPYCGSTKNDVFNSRATRSNTQIWRRRRCRDCGGSTTTYERVDLSAVLLIDRGTKKHNRYNRSKLILSLLACFDVASINSNQLDSLVDTLEQKLIDLKSDIIARAELTDIILHTLKPVDTSAFMKYLANHGQISGNRELNSLLKKY